MVQVRNYSKLPKVEVWWHFWRKQSRMAGLRLEMKRFVFCAAFQKLVALVETGCCIGVRDMLQTEAYHCLKLVPTEWHNFWSSLRYKQILCWLLQVNWDNVRVLPNGETVSVQGTHLGGLVKSVPEHWLLLTIFMRCINIPRSQHSWPQRKPPLHKFSFSCWFAFWWWAVTSKSVCSDFPQIQNSEQTTQNSQLWIGSFISQAQFGSLFKRWAAITFVIVCYMWNSAILLAENQTTARERER
jgi:hypothetical protein